MIGTGLDEAFGVERDAAIEATSVRIGTGHDEYVADLVLLSLSRFASERNRGDRLLLGSRSQFVVGKHRSQTSLSLSKAIRKGSF